MEKFSSKIKIFIAVLFLLLGITLIYTSFLVLSLFDKEDVSKIHNPDNYKEIYKIIKDNLDNNNSLKGDFVEMDNSLNEKVNAVDYSDTNLQVLGVQEADIIKTDGEYIYALSQEYLYIIKTNNENMSIISKIKYEQENESYNTPFSEIYIYENKLIAIKNTYEYLYKYDVSGKDIMPGIYGGNNSKVSAIIFDISDKTNPVKINELTQSGSYISSRMINNYLYIATNYYVYSNNVKEDDASTYVPLVSSDKDKPISIDDIYILPNPSSSSYLTVTGIDVNNAKDFISTKAVFGSASNLYASLENMYITSYEGITEDNIYKTKTNIMKFKINNGNINYEKTGSVNGTILNQFSMDEYNDYFRIVTTSNDYEIITNPDGITSSIDFDNNTKNNLYVLDNNLNLVSRLEGLGKGETIQSVRFNKDVVYFVTFKRIDPLFVVDLIDVNNPRVLTELKIPGFSEYLQVYNDKLLFGLGKEADEEGRITGVKISMYDITDKTNVIEKFKTVMGDQYSWSEASYNHKAILVSKNKELIGFPINDKYVLYTLTNDGFKLLGEVSFNEEDNDKMYYYYGNIRGLYINNYLYVFNQNQIKSINLSNFSDTNTLEFK